MTLFALTLSVILFLAPFQSHKENKKSSTSQNTLCTANKSKPKHKLINPCDFIAHAGGHIDGYIYTNSKEAILQSVKNGYKFIEIDFIETSDGFLVAAHDWKRSREFTQLPAQQISEEPLSLKEFKSKKILNRYTPLTAAEVYKIFSQNPKLILVTDKTRNFKLLNKEIPLKNRMIVEVFGTDEYKRAKEEGIVNPMLNVSDMSEIDFVNKENVRFVATSTQTLENYPKKFEELFENEVQIFVYTSNEKKLIENHLGKRASAFYTDFWDLKRGACGVKDCKTINE